MPAPGRDRRDPFAAAARLAFLHYDGEAVMRIYDFACAEAQRYREGGVDGLIVENHGDIPFAKPDELGPETAACMAVMAERVRRESGLPIGIRVPGQQRGL